MYKIAITIRKKDDHMTFFMNNTYYQWLFPYFDIELVVPRRHHDYSDIVKRNDMLLICGGNDIDPYYYHQEKHYLTILEDDLIEAMDFALLQQFYHANKPIIGICRGIQVINVFFKGTLYQDIPSLYPSALQHSQATHPVYLPQDTLLSKFFPHSLIVNSFHHQNIHVPSPLFRINAKSIDGLIEGIENDLVVAVQWHPERMDSHHQYQFIQLMLYMIEKNLDKR